jgi:cell division protein ZapE
MPHRALNVPEHGMMEAYEAELKARGFEADPAQRAAAARLQGLYGELLAFKEARSGTLRRLFKRPQMPRSVYFWGGVGRGKSFLMDCFFEAVPYRRKRRVHFHAFMQEVQNDLKSLNREPDPLQKVADRIARQTRLLCFDEFHVSDIADAMILGRLLDALFARGVIFVMTSNYPPDGLYPNGLQRINFIPTIEMMKKRFDVIGCARWSGSRSTSCRPMPRPGPRCRTTSCAWPEANPLRARSRCSGARFRRSATRRA